VVFQAVVTIYHIAIELYIAGGSGDSAVEPRHLEAKFTIFLSRLPPLPSNLNRR